MYMKNLLAVAMVVPMKNHISVDSPDQILGLPVCVEGPPGIGKSETIEALGDELTLLTHTVFIPSCTPEDLMGYPVQDGVGKLVRSCDDPIIHEIAERKSGLVFLDEINTNRQNIYAGLLSVLLKRRFGGVPLGGGTRFISAMNGDADSVGSIPFPPPISNRFCHIKWEAGGGAEYLDWLSGTGDRDDDKVSPVDLLSRKRDENWSGAWSEFVGKAAGFFKVREATLHTGPLEADPTKGWASRRTWFWALRAMATCRALKAPEKIRLDLLRGCVGVGPATEFMKWEKESDLPTPEDVLKNGFEPDTTRIDRSMAVYESLSSYVVGMKKGPEQLKAATTAWGVLRKGADSSLADTLSRPVIRLVNANLSLSSGDQECSKAAQPVMARIQPQLDKMKKMRQALGGP